MVQFGAIAYSPRLVLLFVRNPTLFHTLGIFVATFVYSLATLAWTDRGGSGSVPVFSSALVVIMVVVSMILFSLLVQRLFFPSIRRHTRCLSDWSSDVCSSDLCRPGGP